MTISPYVTFSVLSSNVDALKLCLSSVLLGKVIPARIDVYLNGHIADLSDFYLEQLATLARFHGSVLRYSVISDFGVRKSRQLMLEEAQTEWVWMGDDDCIFQPDCLSEMISAASKFSSNRSLDYSFFDSHIAYFAGCKVDLNNRRGYANFDTTINPESNLVEGCSLNHLYEPSETYPRTFIIDTGNCFIRPATVLGVGVTFDPFPDGLPVGGEDWLFGLQVHKRGLFAHFVPKAIAFHLEKKNGPRFDELTTRKEMLFRCCDSLGLSKEKLAQALQQEKV